jgi:hypothetical protein
MQILILIKSFRIEIVGKKFEINDEKISAVGKIVKLDEDARFVDVEINEDDDVQPEIEYIYEDVTIEDTGIANSLKNKDSSLKQKNMNEELDEDEDEEQEEDEQEDNAEEEDDEPNNGDEEDDDNINEDDDLEDDEDDDDDDDDDDEKDEEEEEEEEEDDLDDM